MFYLNTYRDYEGFIGPEYLRLWDIDSLLENNHRYDIITYHANVLVIGTNMGGESIAIEYKGDEYRIVRSPFIDFGPQNYVEIGTTFTNMLDRLDSGQEWFS